jgi:hypothetical protein
MDDRSEEARLANLRESIKQVDPGLWLTDEDVDALVEIGTEGLQMLYRLNAADDSRTINVICDVLEPRVTLIIHGGPICTCPRRHYHASSRRVSRDNKHAA